MYKNKVETVQIISFTQWEWRRLDYSQVSLESFF